MLILKLSITLWYGTTTLSRSTCDTTAWSTQCFSTRRGAGQSRERERGREGKGNFGASRQDDVQNRNRMSWPRWATVTFNISCFKRPQQSTTFGNQLTWGKGLDWEKFYMMFIIRYESLVAFVRELFGGGSLLLVCAFFMPLLSIHNTHCSVIINRRFFEMQSILSFLLYWLFHLKPGSLLWVEV